MGDSLISPEQEELLAQLRQDVQIAFQNVAAHDPFWCRTLVRAVFSYFEAHGYVIRSIAMKLLQPDTSNFESIAKVALLAEIAFQPGRTGKLEEAPEPKTQFVNYFAFTLRTYAEACGMGDEDINKFFSDNAFDQLQRATKVRNKLTHPKQLGDVTVTEADVLNVTNAFHWVDRFLSEVEKLPQKIP
jgi:hypothetical protein